MIHLFGDSWGFSYTPGEKFNDVISGACLAECLTAELSSPVINYAHRGFDNTQIVASIIQHKSEIHPGDTVIVLQTDPLRNLVYSWHPGTEPRGYTFTKPRSLNQVCEDVMHDFYAALAQIQQDLNIKILLHGGCSKLNQTIASAHGLVTTTRTSTEIICPEFSDTYYYVDLFVMHTHEKLKNTSDQYLFTTQQAFDLFVQVKEKEKLWKSRPDVFTLNHTTELGTQLIAKYLATSITLLQNAYNARDFMATFCTTDIYRQLQTDYKHISFENSFRDYLEQFDSPLNLKRLAWETKELTPRQGFDKLGSYFSAVPFYYINFLLQNHPESIADIGCGGNHFKKYIPAITGYDISPDADVSTYFTSAFVADNEEKFDAAFSICSIHYIGVAQVEQRVTDFAKIIRPGGRGFVAMNYQRLIDNPQPPLNGTPLEILNVIRDALLRVAVRPLVLDLQVTEDTQTHDAFIDGNIRFVFEKLSK